ncbi:MAG: T9SS type A sorting domain-containing protein [Crocinitomicaceae bacterium]
MKTLLILLMAIFHGLLLSQYQTIESSLKRDLIEKAMWSDGNMYYFNNLKFPFEFNQTQTPIEVSGNLAYFNFSTENVVKTPIFSKSDSINSILSIVKDNNNVMYTFRVLRESNNDLNPSYFLEKRSNDLSQILETNQIYLTGNIGAIVNAFFDDNNILYLKGFQSQPQYRTAHYAIQMNNTILDNSSTYPLDKYQFHEIDDSTFISYASNTNQIIYYKKDTFEIVSGVNIVNQTISVNSKSKIIDNYFFLNGVLSGGSSQAPNLHSLYKHEIGSDTSDIIFIDSIVTTTEDARFANFSLDLIDTNYIYSGANYSDCPAIAGYNCIGSFKIYSNKFNGELRWSKTIGGDGNNELSDIYATPDSGCFVLFFRHTIEDSINNGDMFWLKYDKYGNEDPNYLSEFHLSTNAIEPEKKQIFVFPNPTSSVLNFSGLTGQVNISIYNLLGQKLYDGSSVNSQVDVTYLPSGTYFYKVSSAFGNASQGKFVKL